MQTLTNQDQATNRKLGKMSTSSNPAGSATSTTCSTPPPHDIYSVILSEESRYKRKGYGLIFAILIANSYHFLSPMLVKQIWPSVLQWIDEVGL